MPAVLLFWVNSHQMFWVGLVIEIAFLGHLVIVRHLDRLNLFDSTDRELPIRPILLAIGLSCVACFLSPIGWRVMEVPAQTFGSLYFHRENVDEFAPFYTSRQAVWLVSVSGMAAAAGFILRNRRQRPFEWMVWLLGLAMVMGAIRGTPFFVAISLGLFARALLDWIRDPQGDRQSHLSDRIAIISRLASATIVLLLCGQVYWARWIHPTHILGGSQFGIGKTVGAWPDEAIAFLKQNLPPGKMINLSWYSGNALIWELNGRSPVFVDPRFEAYPRSFLIDALAAENDATTLDRLMDEYRPGWFVGELRVPGVRSQMARLYLEGEWEFVHIDPILAIMVKRDAEQSDYLAEHRIDPSKIEPASLLRDHPELLAQQQIRLASLMADLGKLPAAKRWYWSAREAARYRNVEIGLAELRSLYPELEATASAESIGSSRSSQFEP